MKLYTVIILFFVFQQPVFVTAQKINTKSKKWYRSDGGDVCLFSFSNVTRNGDKLKNIPRFIYMNGTTYFNKDLSENIGFHTGYSFNNIGLIYDDNDSIRFKRRLITFGLPIGLKFGNLTKGSFFFLEGQMNIALNYKEKRFLNDKKIDKSNTWFGNQTSMLIPSVSAGWIYEGFGFRTQYFPSNFFNTEYEKDGVKPFAGLQSQIVILSFSYNIKARSKKKPNQTGISFISTFLE